MQKVEFYTILTAAQKEVGRLGSTATTRQRGAASEGGDTARVQSQGADARVARAAGELAGLVAGSSPHAPALIRAERAAGAAAGAGDACAGR